MTRLPDNPRKRASSRSSQGLSSGRATQRVPEDSDSLEVKRTGESRVRIVHRVQAVDDESNIYRPDPRALLVLWTRAEQLAIPVRTAPEGARKENAVLEAFLDLARCFLNPRAVFGIVRRERCHLSVGSNEERRLVCMPNARDDVPVTGKVLQQRRVDRGEAGVSVVVQEYRIRCPEIGERFAFNGVGLDQGVEAVPPDRQAQKRGGGPSHVTGLIFGWLAIHLPGRRIPDLDGDRAVVVRVGGEGLWPEVIDEMQVAQADGVRPGWRREVRDR